MSGMGYYTRLAAVLAVSAAMGAVIMKPGAGKRAVEMAATLAPSPAATSIRSCVAGETPLTGPFAPLDDILSISPLGAVTAPGEPLPAPYLRFNTRRGENAFARRETTALAPARAVVTAIERRIERDETGAARAESWTVRLKPCDSLTLYFDRLDAVDPELLRRAGGLAKFTELGGPDHLARETSIGVRTGDVIGTGDGFDVGLHDLSASPAPLARPERYGRNPYEHAAVFKAPPSLIEAITDDHTRARCALDYLPQGLRADWSEKLGDAWGVRRARGDNACRTALVDSVGAAQGAWFTDASHNALTRKVSAVALAPDAVDPERLIFALHGRLASLTPDKIALAPMLEEARAAAAKDFFTFERGEGRINAPFDAVKPGETYCYQALRANFVGPKLDGVLLLRIDAPETGPALMKIEARGDFSSCADLDEPWSFTGNETTFYR